MNDTQWQFNFPFLPLSFTLFHSLCRKTSTNITTQHMNPTTFGIILNRNITAAGITTALGEKMLGAFSSLFFSIWYCCWFFSRSPPPPSDHHIGAYSFILNNLCCAWDSPERRWWWWWRWLIEFEMLFRMQSFFIKVLLNHTIFAYQNDIAHAGKHD